MTPKFDVVLLFLFFLVNSVVCDSCGKIFKEKHFILKSENYPYGPYPEYKNCYYLIKGEQCTEFFEFEFIDLNIKKSIGCTEERLEVGDQDAICGSRNGTKIYKAEHGELKLKFVATKIEERDIFNKGFKIYVKRVECPSNSIGVDETTKFKTEEFTHEVPYEWTTSIVPTTISTPTYFNPNLRQCCNQNVFNSKKFVIISPNFPFSVNTPEECAFVITKANPDICRIKLNLIFFYLGQSTYNSCPYGHLEIDGKYICGCNSNVNIISNFGYSSTKILNFKTFGIPLKNSYSGFVLEVTQEECPKKYRPDNSYLPPVQVKSFRSYEDTEHRIRWPNEGVLQTKLVRNKRSILIDSMESAKEKSTKTNNNVFKIISNQKAKARNKRNSIAKALKLNGQPNINIWPDGTEIEKAKLLSEKTYVERSAANEISNDFKNVLKYVYYFAPEGENQGVDIDIDQGVNEKREETTNYIDTSKINTILTNLYEYEKCCQWNQVQFNTLRSQYGNNLKNVCRVPQKDSNFEKNDDCVVLESVSGNVRTPNHPLGYPAGLNLCYRFHILPGYCEIKLFFNDFHLENSQDCQKDYLKLPGSGYRYCGSYLSKTTSILNARENPAPEVRFVSDFYNNGRGFSLYYNQSPCNRYYTGNMVIGNPIPSISSRNSPSDSSSSLHKHQVPNGNNTGVDKSKPIERSSIECDKIIEAEAFSWKDGELSGGKDCEVRIRKVNKDVCKLKLALQKFNLKCDKEFIMIGDREFCGNLTGQEVIFNMDTPEKLIKYKNRQKNVSDDLIMDTGTFTILGRQIDENCDFGIRALAYIPEIQRKLDTVDNTAQIILEGNESNNNLNIMDKNKDICDLLQKSTTPEMKIVGDRKISTKICDLLKSRYNATECDLSNKNIAAGNSSYFQDLIKLKLVSNNETESFIMGIKC